MTKTAMRIGDIVRPTGGRVLRSGCNAYDDAVVVSIEPFVLVSREADMRWSATVAREDFEVVGAAPTGVTNRCMRRL